MDQLNYPDLLSFLRACDSVWMTKIGLNAYRRNPDTRVKIHRSSSGKTTVATWKGDSQASAKDVSIHPNCVGILDILSQLPSRLDSIALTGMSFSIQGLCQVLECSKTIHFDNPAVQDYEDIFYYVCYLGNQGRFMHIDNLTLTRTKEVTLNKFGVAMACFVKSLSWPSYFNLEMCLSRKELLQGLIEAAQICLPEYFRY